MPIMEHRCVEPGCPQYGHVFERFFHRYESEPECSVCGARTQRIASLFNAVWVHGLSHYNDPRRENPRMEGYWAWRRNSTPDGKPRPEYIDSVQKARAFAKDEGLISPTDVPSNCRAGADGKSWECRGMPGQEV